MDRRNKVLTALLALQLLIIGFLYLPQHDRAPTATDLLPGLSPEQIVSLAIADDEGNKVLLSKANDAWTVDAPQGFPADSDKIESLLKKLASMKSSRLVTRTAASHNRLKVSDTIFNRRLDITDSSGNSFLVYLGSEPNYKSMHVRPASEDNVYLFNDFSSWEVQAEPDTWWNTRYLEVKPDTLLKVSLKNSNGEFVFAVNGDGKWYQEGKEKPFAKEAMEDFFTDILTITLSEVPLKQQGLELPEAIAELDLQTKDAAIHLAVGPENKDQHQHLIKSGQSPFYVYAPHYVVKTLVEFRGDLALEETTSPVTGSGS